MPRVEQLRGFALAVVARPCIVDIVSDGDAARRFRIPESSGRLLVNGQRQQFFRAEGFAQRLDEFGIGGRIHSRHALLAVAGISIPEVYTVESVLFDNGLDLRGEVFDLGIGEVAEPEPRASAFDADTYLASVFLQRTDIFRRLAEHIGHVGSKVEQGSAGCSIVADLDGAQVDDVAYGLVPCYGRAARQFLLHNVIQDQQRLKIVRIDIEHEEQVVAVVQGVFVGVGLANRNVVVKRLVRVRCVLCSDRKR